MNFSFSSACFANFGNIAGINAPRFKHVTPNTNTPVKTPISYFEVQLIVGRLNNSSVLFPQISRVFNGQSLYIPKRDKDRFLSGFVLSYNTKGISGLFIVANQLSQMNNQNAGQGISNFLPLLLPFKLKKKHLKEISTHLCFSAGCWVNQKHKFMMSMVIEENQISTSVYKRTKQICCLYFWFQKNCSAKKTFDEYLKVSLELTELQQITVPEQGGWYTSSVIRQGYTHMERVWFPEQSKVTSYQLV